jgi:lipopolysaccharide transport system ATP-binding protein
MGVVIKVENLSKKYLIRHEKKSGSYETFSDTIIQGSKNIAKKIIHPFSDKEGDSQTREEFWALKDVNFEINQGDKVGIIGRNGSGKSTLLKLLSRITEPTSGKIHINGRIASLLEVGTGFHPELTGRENIYLNGAILGMSRKEIKAKFDEIVAFAEVETFLDTPVKRYSSGMYVRLAFSVAAHLEPEILVVDEVLSVGDMEFQKKCLGKIQDISKAGRTILFVSHNMKAVGNICNKGIQLKQGKVAFQNNSIQEVISKYMETPGNLNSLWENAKNNYQHINFTPQKLWVSEVGDYLPKDKPFSNSQKIQVNIEFQVNKLNTGLLVGFRLYSVENELVFASNATDTSQELWPNIKLGCNVFSAIIPSDLLNDGKYRLELVSSIFYKEWIIQPQKEDINVYFIVQACFGASPHWRGNRGGILAPVLEWHTKN